MQCASQGLPVSNATPRIPSLLLRGRRVRQCHDLQDCAHPRQEEPADLPLDLLDCRIRLCHVRQGLRHCGQAHFCRPQPVHSRLYIRFHDLDDRLHSDPDELLQQGISHLLDSNVLCPGLTRLFDESMANNIAESTPYTTLPSRPPLYALPSFSSAASTRQMRSTRYRYFAGSSPHSLVSTCSTSRAEIPTATRCLAAVATATTLPVPT